MAAMGMPAAVSDAMKNRRRTTTKAKRPSAPKVRRHKPSNTNANTKNALLKRERDEALEQQKAAAEALRIISASPGDLKPVFDAMLANAVRLCEAKFGFLWLAENDGFCPIALHNVPHAPAFARQHDQVIHFDPDTPIGRLAGTRRLVHVADITSDPGYINGFRPLRELADIGGARTLLLVPMLKHKELVGAFAIYRLDVRPFTDKQIELVENFAAQAVIAIENTRLLNELRQRTNDLTKSLEQQTATSEVLGVISSSPGELEPVFQTILGNATRICEAKFGTLYLFDANAFLWAAQVGAPPEYAEFLRQRGPFQPAAGLPLNRMWRTKDIVRVADDLSEPVLSPATKFGGSRSQIAVPMLKDNALIGAIIIYRQEVRPFTDKQVALVKNFASQAVIAIENTRLLNELRQSLEQQTATAEVLSVISTSPGELEPVFDAMLENATRICEAKFGTLYLRDGESYRAASMFNVPPAFAEFRRRGPIHPGPRTGLSRVMKTKQLVHIADIKSEQAYIEGDPIFVNAVEAGGFRTVLHVPMLNEEQLVGVIAIYRQEVHPFTDKQIALVQNFAAQAVIAIENTRLLNELRQRTDDISESLEQQTATSEVLRVISSSPTNVQPVLDAIVRTAVSLCNSYDAVILLREGEHLRIAAHHGPMALDFERLPLGRDFVSGRTVIDGVPLHVPDFMAAGAEFPRGREVAKRLKQRTVLGLPLRREGQTIGCLFLRRTKVLAFTDKQIELLTTFADQAVIAIENVRLFEAEQQRTRELSESLEQQTATSEVLSVISSSPGELEPVFDAMLQNAVRICDAKLGNLWVREGDKFRIVAIHGASQEYREYLFSEPLVLPDPESAMGRVAATGQVLQIDDISTAPTYGMRMRIATIEIAKARTLVAVPMLKDNEVVGIIGIYRQDVRGFADKQIALVQNFAAQAVIAIENTRLLNELRESLQQQTATADVLKVISSSPGELKPVFDAMLENATRICEAKVGNLFLWDGVDFRAVAVRRVRLCRLVPARPYGKCVRTVRLATSPSDQDQAGRPHPGSSAGANLHRRQRPHGLTGRDRRSANAPCRTHAQRP